MAEWLYEAGIGENRAILVADGAIVEARVERPGLGRRAGTVARARLVAASAGQALVRFADDSEAILASAPKGAAIGGALIVEVVREAIPEPGKAKRMVARASDATDERMGPGLLDRIATDGALVTHCAPHDGEDRFEAAGWSETLAEAASGEVAFVGGALRISLTPAMTLIDVDGAPGDAFALAQAGIAAAGGAIRRLDLTGSIGIDLPTVADRAQRQALADALDAIVPQPFERTAVNGFGFVQLVRRRTRASLAELLRYRPVESAALATLRRAERAGGTGPATLVLAPRLADWLGDRPDLVAMLSRRIGREVTLASDPDLTLEGGHLA